MKKGIKPANFSGKRLASLLCAALLLVSLSASAFAVKTPDQATGESVSTTLDATSFSGSFDGCWWNISDLIYAFLPETWEEEELTEEDSELGVIAVLFDPESDALTMFSVTDLDGLAEDAVEYATELVKENGYTGYENTVNGYPAVIYFDDYNYVNLVMGSSAALTVSFYPADDDAFMDMVQDIIRTLTPVANVDIEDMADTILGQVALYGSCEIPVTITNASGSSVITGFYACAAGETSWENILPEGTVIAPGESLSGFDLAVVPAFLYMDFGVRYGDEATNEFLSNDLSLKLNAPMEIICEDRGDSTSMSFRQTTED